MVPGSELFFPSSFPSCVSRWKSGHYASMATVFISCSVLILNPILVACIAQNETFGTVECVLGNDTTCPENQCCVKKVITYRNPRAAKVGTECQPLQPLGAMCLKNREEYICPCRLGMKCDLASKFDTMGHCRPKV